MKTAEVLDYRRLGKQRVETKQILMTLLGESKGWANHPAVKMWAGYEMTLALYGLQMCREWKKRGYNDSLEDYFLGEIHNLRVQKKIPDGLPEWFGDPDFHRSHQSNLLRKDGEYYGSHFPDVPDDLPYIWPTKASLDLLTV